MNISDFSDKALEDNGDQKQLYQYYQQIRQFFEQNKKLGSLPDQLNRERDELLQHNENIALILKELYGSKP